MQFKGANFLSNAFLFYSRDIGEHPSKRRLLNFMHQVFKNRIKVKGTNGAILQLVPKDYISTQIIFSKSYEPLSLNLALELLKDTEGCFLDVGGNIGLFSNMVAKSYPDKQIIAIEPEENNFKLLNKNLLENTPNKAITLNIAVGESVKLIQLERPVDNNNGTFRVVLEKQAEENKGRYYPMLDLKTVLQELNVSKVSLMKIDIEGHEMEAFKGMDWLSSNKPDHIIMEYSDYVGRTGSSADDVLNYLTEKGYKAYSIDKKPYVKGDQLPEDNLWLTLL
jgi:FkbM family methyltransferase